MLQDAFDRSHMPVSWDGITTRLTTEGWERISASNVTHFYVKGDAVMRINRNYDYGYANYTELSLHVPSPHFVQFAWHDFLQDDTHVALLEKLEPTPPDRQLSRALRPTLRALWQLGNYLLPFTDEDMVEAGYPGLSYRGDLAREFDKDYLAAQKNDLAAQSPSLVAALSLLQSYLMKLAEDDFRFLFPVTTLSPSNLMIRRDQVTAAETIVIADPYVYDYQAEPNYSDSDDNAIEALEAVFGLPNLPNLKVYKYERNFS